MKKMVMALGFVAALMFIVTPVFADDPGAPPQQQQMGEMGHSHHKDWKCGKEFSLTPEQKAKFRELRQNFRRDNAQLIGSLIAKKIELKALWRDPQADPNAIMAKARELRGIQDQLKDRRVGMRLEFRKILTPEQIAHWKPGAMWRHMRRRHQMMGEGRMWGHERHMHRHHHMMEGGMWGHGDRHGHGMMEHGMMEHGMMMEHGGMMGRGYGRCGCE